MIHHPDERDQLEMLHDRHKRFSLEVYDHSVSNDKIKLAEAQKNLKVVVKELDDLKKKLHPKSS